MEAVFEHSQGIWLYLVILGFLIATGFGLPLSEDFLVMITGFFIESNRMSPAGGFMIALVGCLMSDAIMFNIGYHYGHAVRKHRFILRVISHGRQEIILSKFRKYGDKFVFFARFIAGVRAPTFLTAGISRMHPLRFFALDGMASLLSVPLFLGLGYAFGNQLTKVQEDISQIRTIIILVLIAGFGLYIIARYLNAFWQGPEGDEQ
jgi:membrane protein DedA with SNARE-associated domain